MMVMRQNLRTGPDLQLEWGEDIPPEYRDAVGPLLYEFAWLVPPWCRLIRVMNAVAAQNEETATMDLREEYRFARLTLTPWFLEGDPSTRRRVVVHELLHVFIAPMAEVLFGLLEQTENEPLRGIVRNQWHKAMESGIQDLAYAITGREEPGESDL